MPERVVRRYDGSTQHADWCRQTLHGGKCLDSLMAAYTPMGFGVGMDGPIFWSCPYCRTLVKRNKRVLGNWHWCELKRLWANRVHRG
jgi:hypothetical protein